MAEKKDAYELISNAFLNSQLDDDELEKNFPKINAWFNSASTKEDRLKRLSSVLGDPDFQKELRQFDDFADFDFSEFKPPEKNVYKPGELKNADMKDVQKFYAKAKSVIDPTGKLGETELYDTAGDATFQQLEEKIGEDYTGDWFGELLNAFNYPDTPEGYEQLTQDFQAAMTRMKNKDFTKKFGKAEAPLKFVFGKTFNALEDGKKAGIGDVAVDAGSNILWLVSPTKFLPIVKSVVGGATKVVPKLGKVEGMLAKADAPRTALGEVLKNVSVNGVAPAFHSFGDYVLGTDTEEEKRNGLTGRAIEALTGTGVNLAIPGYAEGIVSSVFNRLGRKGLNPENAARVANSIGTFLNFGSRQEQARSILAGLLGKTDFAKRTAKNFAQNLSKNKKVFEDAELGRAAASLPRSLMDSGRNLAHIVSENGGNLGAGVKNFVKSNTNKVDEEFWRTVADIPENIWDLSAPFVVNYVLNRMGTDEFGSYLSNILARPIRRISGKDEE